MEQKENNYLKELRRIATIESIGSSTRIEGVQLTDNEIKELLENMEITKLVTRDQQEVVGYFDVLEIKSCKREVNLFSRSIEELIVLVQH